MLNCMQEKQYQGKSIQNFLDELASKTPTPGGGSAAALTGALAAALSSMVANLTIGKKKFEQVEDEMKTVLLKCERLRTRFTELIIEDDRAFSALMDAFKMPRNSKEEREVRSSKIQESTKTATLLPLEMMQLCCELLPLAMAAAVKGNPNAISDAGISALLAGTTAQAAALNVNINLLGIQDRKWAQDKFNEVNRLLKEIRQGTETVMKLVTQKLSGQ